LITHGCRVKPGALFTQPVSFTMRTTRSSDPISARSAASETRIVARAA
jgi:hypothetical protein